MSVCNISGTVQFQGLEILILYFHLQCCELWGSLRQPCMLRIITMETQDTTNSPSVIYNYSNKTQPVLIHNTDHLNENASTFNEVCKGKNRRPYIHFECRHTPFRNRLVRHVGFNETLEHKWPVKLRGERLELSWSFVMYELYLPVLKKKSNQCRNLFSLKIAGILPVYNFTRNG